MTRKYTPVERKLVSQWLEKFHVNALQWKRPRLGVPPGDPPDPFKKQRRRYPDIIFKSGNTIWIGEAKMRPDPGGLSQVELYAQLFPKTPEFSEWKNLPVKMFFLTTLLDPEVKQLARSKGIDYIVFKPKWVTAWWEEKMRVR